MIFHSIQSIKHFYWIHQIMLLESEILLLIHKYGRFIKK